MENCTLIEINGNSNRLKSEKKINNTVLKFYIQYEKVMDNFNKSKDMTYFAISTKWLEQWKDNLSKEDEIERELVRLQNNHSIDYIDKESSLYKDMIIYGVLGYF